MELDVSAVIDRSVATVWNFYAVHHVENHPRWDPDLKLENTSGGPIGVGTVIKRRSTRFEVPTEGTMEIVEFEPDSDETGRTHLASTDDMGVVVSTRDGAGRDRARGGTPDPLPGGLRVGVR